MPEKSPQCLVHLLDRYLNKLPQFAFDNDVLYCQLKGFTPVNDKAPWYKPVPVGKNKLGTMVKDMCLVCGISGGSKGDSWGSTEPPFQTHTVLN